MMLWMSQQLTVHFRIRISVRLNIQLFVGELMSYLPYLCLLAYSSVVLCCVVFLFCCCVQHILCVVLFSSSCTSFSGLSNVD